VQRLYKKLNLSAKGCISSFEKFTLSPAGTFPKRERHSQKQDVLQKKISIDALILNGLYYLMFCLNVNGLFCVMSRIYFRINDFLFGV